MHLNGWAGVGKLTVNRAPARLLSARLVDNHTLQNLALALGERTAKAEVERALRDLRLPADEGRPYALRQLRERIEANLSGLLGPAVAYDIMQRLYDREPQKIGPWHAPLGVDIGRLYEETGNPEEAAA